MLSSYILRHEQRFLLAIDRRHHPLRFYLFLLLPMVTIGAVMFSLLPVFRMQPGEAFVASFLIVTQLLFSVRAMHFSAFSVVRERQAKAWDTLRLTHLTAQTMIWYKWRAIVGYLLGRFWLVLLVRPVLVALAAAGRGVPGDTVLYMVLFASVYPLFEIGLTTAIGLLCSSVVSSGFYALATTAIMRVLLSLALLLTFSWALPQQLVPGFAAAGDLVITAFFVLPTPVELWRLAFELLIATLTLLVVVWSTALMLLTAVVVVALAGLSTRLVPVLVRQPAENQYDAED